MTIEKFSRKRKSDTKLTQSNETVFSIPQVKEAFIGTEIVYIDGGTFQMGSNHGNDNEKPVHSVTVSSFYIGKYPVTNKEYCCYNPSHKNPGDYLPVVNVSWNDAMKYCKWLSNKTDKSYRLPTEAEWEYACKAGTTTKYYWGDEMDGNYCWYKENSGGKVHPVGQKLPNAWDLYDMSGNVWEWCNDWYGKYPSGSIIEPTGTGTGSYRVDRGGGWNGIADYCRSAFRDDYSPVYGSHGVGFRLVRDP